jgi:anti-sigma regulatory factor (Ser/Thr protein kinase)
VLQDLGAHAGPRLALYLKEPGTAVFSLASVTSEAEATAARRELSSWLGKLSLDTLVAQDVLIAACEACANAIEHGYRGFPAGTVRLRVEVSGADVRTTVADSGG